MNTQEQEQELHVQKLSNERDMLRNKVVKFTAYTFVSVLAIVITLGAVILNNYSGIAIPENTSIAFAISAISFFILKNTKKKIEEQENIASIEYENALSEFNAGQEAE